MTYVALLRGIGPGNPNMRSEKLKSAFESLGFKNVATVIGSGNVVFDSPSKSAAALEAKIERMLPLQLGFKRAAIVRSREELETFVRTKPFKRVKDERPNYLLVTFFKDRRKPLCSVLDMNDGSGKTTNFMANLDRAHKKAVTSRTWKTVGRILAKMEKCR